MSRLSVLVVVLAFTGQSTAMARPSTTTMSCAVAAATVAKAGAIVLTTGPGTYERFVVASTNCLAGEVTQPASAPTTDSKSCAVGYVCRPREQYEPSAK